MKTNKITEKIDGRKMRWFDCRWNDGGLHCEQCRLCKYFDFLDMAESVGLPDGSIIAYEPTLDDYIKLKTAKEKKEYYLRIK